MKKTTEEFQKERELVSDIACKKYKNVINKTNNSKFKHLHRSMQFRSNSFEIENSKNGRVTNFQKYKRGSIVMVNFGTNIGYELSGNHFAIILTKDDNKMNGVVTVVPLTSKEKKAYLEINESIHDLVNNVCDIFYVGLKKDISTLKNEDRKVDDLIKKLKKDIKKNEKLLQLFTVDSADLINEIVLLKKHIDENMKNVNEMHDMNKGQAFLIQQNIKCLRCVLEKYEKSKNKKSYVMMRNINTISKHKIIKPINKYDPIGKIKISNETLDSIDKEIMYQYTNIK